MIVLDDKWCVEADAYQYILYRPGKEYAGKGVTKMDASFHPTLAQAVERYARIRESRLINSGAMPLGEAVAEIRKLNEEIIRLRKAIENACKLEMPPQPHDSDV